MANNVEKKITKVMKLSAIIALLKDMDANEVLVTEVVKTGRDTTQPVAITAGMAIEFAEHEIELLSKKNSGKGKTSKVNEAQTQMEAEILDFLADHPNQVFSASELCKAIPGFAEQNPPVSTQKITPRLNAMLKRGEVKVSKDKGKNFWQYDASCEDEYKEDYED